MPPFRTLSAAIAGALLAWPFALLAQDRPDPIVIERDGTVAVNGKALVVGADGAVSIGDTAVRVGPDGGVTVNDHETLVIYPTGEAHIGNKLYLWPNGSVVVRDQTGKRDRLAISPEGKVVIDSGEGGATITVSPEGAVTISTADEVTINAKSGTAIAASETGRPLYVTGNLDKDKGVEFRHYNETQGIGFGFDTIYATGTRDDQSLWIRPRAKGRLVMQGEVYVGDRENETQFPVVTGSVLRRYSGTTTTYNCVSTGSGDCGDQSIAVSCRGPNSTPRIADLGSCNWTDNEAAGGVSNPRGKGASSGRSGHCELYLCYSGKYPGE